MSADHEWYEAAPGVLLRRHEEGGAHLSDGTSTVYVRPEALVPLGKAVIATRVVQARVKVEKTSRERGSHRKES